MLEQEIKLTADDATTLDAVINSALVKSLDSGIGAQNNVRYLGKYYDTDARILAANFYSLRARLEGDKWRAALKFDGSIVNGLSRRQELQADINGALDCPDQLPAGELREKVLGVLPADAKLRAFVTVEMQRSIRNLMLHDTAIELVADNAVIHGATQRTKLYEVELELISGDLAQVIELGETLAKEFKLTPSTATKHRIGLQLG